MQERLQGQLLPYWFTQQITNILMFYCHGYFFFFYLIRIIRKHFNVCSFFSVHFLCFSFELHPLLVEFLFIYFQLLVISHLLKVLSSCVLSHFTSRLCSFPATAIVCPTLTDFTFCLVNHLFPVQFSLHASLCLCLLFLVPVTLCAFLPDFPCHLPLCCWTLLVSAFGSLALCLPRLNGLSSFDIFLPWHSLSLFVFVYLYLLLDWTCTQKLCL